MDEETIKFPIGEPFPFVAKVRKANEDGSLIVTIPLRATEMIGLKPNDPVKVWVKKGQTEKKEEE